MIKKTPSRAAKTAAARSSFPNSPKKKGANRSSNGHQPALAAANPKSNGQQPPTDLRQPKDRDPRTGSKYRPLWNQMMQGTDFDGKGILCSHLFSMAANAADSATGAGNEWYLNWCREQAIYHADEVERFDSRINDDYGMPSLEEMAQDQYERFGNELYKSFRYLCKHLDPEDAENTSNHETWALRSSMLAVARQHPFKFFDINDDESDHFRHFWKQQGDDFLLRLDSPLVVFWYMCSAILGHPWIKSFNDGLGRDEDYVFLDTVIQELFRQAYRSCRSPSVNEAVKLKAAKAIDATSILSNEDGGTDDSNAAADEVESMEEDSDGEGDMREGSDEDGEASGSGPPGEAELTEREAQATTSVGAFKTAQGLEDPADRPYKDDSEPMELSPPSTPEHAAASKKSHVGSDEGSPRSSSSEGAPSWAATASDPAGWWTRTPSALPRTVDAKISSFRQINMDGLDRNCSIFDVTLETPRVNQQDLGELWVRKVKKTLATLLSLDLGLEILPIRDDSYQQTNLWIRSRKDISRKLEQVEHLHKYLDLDYGNGKFFLASKALTTLKLRTRLRVAHPLTQDRPIVRNRLHQCIRRLCGGGGCFDTPLQYGDTMKIGALCLYPDGVHIKSMEKELMRHFHFKYPIALRPDWVNIPFEGSNKKLEGIRQLHVHTRTEDAMKIDLELGRWLQPNTPNRKLPWATQVHYIRDWKAAKDDLLNVPADSRLRRAIHSMVNKVRGNEATTEVIFSPDPIEGMLHSIESEAYRELTLLRLLRSIKATPSQAAAANESKQVLEEDDFEPVERRPKSQEPLLSSPTLDAPLGTITTQTSSLSKSDIAAEKLRQRVLEENSVCPLFYSILPSEEGGGLVLVRSSIPV